MEIDPLIFRLSIFILSIFFTGGRQIASWTWESALVVQGVYTFLDGITKRTVMALAKARGYEIVQRHIYPEELSSASEVFLTGTAVEVTPVREIGEYSFTPGDITKTLMDDYDSEVRREVPATLNAA